MTLLHLLGKEVEEKGGNAVVAEVEVFQMHAVLSLTDCLKHIIEFLLSAHQERDGVVVGKADTFPAKLVDYQ